MAPRWTGSATSWPPAAARCGPAAEPSGSWSRSSSSTPRDPWCPCPCGCSAASCGSRSSSGCASRTGRRRVDSPAETGGTARRRAVRLTPRGVIIPAIILGVVFAILLPRIVDYQAVAAALRSLDPGQLALLAAVTAVAWVANSVPYRLLIRRVAWRRVIGADIAGRAVASTIPGPTDIATRILLYTQWGVPLDRASAALVIGGLLETVSVLVLPLIALAIIVVGGGASDPAGAMLAAVGVFVLAAGTAVFGALVRSERLARRIGVALNGALRWLFTRLRRPPPEGVIEGVLRLRVQLHELSNRHGLEAYGAAVLAKLAWFLVLQVSLRACGVGPDVLAPATV